MCVCVCVYLVASQVISVLRQKVGHLLHIDRIIKGSGITDLSLIGRDLQRGGHRGNTQPLS